MTKATFWNDGLTVKRELTPQGIVSIPPAPPGKRGTVRDTKAPGLVLRVTDRGEKSWAHLYYGASAKRKAEKKLFLIGDAKVLSLADARKKSRAVATDLDGGKDPNVEKRKAELARGDGVASLLEEHYAFIAQRDRNRHAEKDAADLRKYVEPVFGKKRIGDISTADVVQFVKGMASTPYNAKNVFGLLKAFLKRAAVLGYIPRSPVADLRFTDIIGSGKVKPRAYEANDADVRAFWNATGELGGPFGAAWRLLLLTGARKDEIGSLKRTEIDFKAKTITLPADRFKSGRVHVIPLSDEALAILKAQPLWNGEYVFSTTGGLKPLVGWSKAKARLDKLAPKLGGGDFRTHDTRRIVRQKLVGLHVEEHIAELVLGHALPGLKGVYSNPAAYLDQKREALDAWAKELRRIVGPDKKAATVTPIRKAA